MSSAGAGWPGFGEFFAAATGREPSDAERQVADHGLPEFSSSPLGPRIVLAWLWRRLRGSEAVAAATPRRLVYVLPQGGLVEPVAAHVGEWLTRMGLIDQVALHVVPGGSDSGGPRWRRDMHRPAIVIGCADYLVSKALNHGYGIGPLSYPIDFALVTNGAQWVFDDAERCERSAGTVRLLASAADRSW